MIFEASRAAFERARKLSPGGVHSPVRAFRSVGGTPLFFQSASGSHFTDLDGNDFLDFCLSWGPLILGHAHPQVVEAVREAATRGLSYGACHLGEADLCSAILEGFPDFERVRLMNSGTEAVMTAVRLARGATGRSLVLKFEGGYHGHLDSLLVKAGSGLATLGTSSSAGVPEQIAGTTLVSPFADEDALRAVFAEHGKNIALVAIEPFPANMGLLPQPGSFLKLLRELCDEHGALLLFDEVITGFRLRYGSCGPLLDGEGAGVKPDLVTLGKIVGGGLPTGAVTGPASLLDQLAPEGPVYQAGTLSGNPVSCAAGLATLRVLREEDPYPELETLGARFQAALETGGPDWLRVQRRGSISWLSLDGSPELPTRADQIGDAGVERFNAMHGRLLERGLYLAPSAHEVIFFSTAHSEADVDALSSALIEEASKLA